MARSQGTSARAQRLNAAIATCLLATATAAALGRVFLGGSATWRLLAAGIASGLLACAMERRNLLAATAVSLVGMILAIGLWVFPETASHWLPTLRTLHAIGPASRQVSELARVQVAPTPPLAPLFLAALTSVWTAIYSAHALAFRAGSPLLAMLPPVALVAFADTVMGESVRPLYGVAFLIAALALVFADALRRVHGWGPVWTGPGKQARLSISAGRSARRVAAVSVAMALMAPVLLPGFGSKAVFDLSGSGGGPIRFDPLVSMASALTRKQVRPVMQVETDQPAYLRMLALSQFDGQTWRADPTPQNRPFVSGPLPVVSQPPGVAHTSRISVRGDLVLPGLPMQYPAISLTGPADDPLTFDAVSGAVTLAHDLAPGSKYDVTWAVPQVSPAQLRGIRFGDLPGDDPNLALPAGTPAGIYKLARQWTEDATSSYDEIIAIQDHLRGPDFRYDTSVDHRDDGATLLDFLTTSRRGFCQQFASAMAVMLRSLGIPARVAVGFTAGTRSSSDSNLWNVSTRNAHSWVEVDFPGYGWLTFDPTPGIENPSTTGYTRIGTGAAPCSTSSGHPCVSGKHDKKSNQGTTDSPGLAALREGGSAHKGGPSSTGSVIAPPRDPWHRARPFVLLGLLAFLVILALMPPLRALRRRLRLLRAVGDPGRLILVTYDVFTQKAAELGFARRPGDTVEEYRGRLVSSGAHVNGHLDRLSSIVSSTAYGPGIPDERTARAAGEAARSAWKDMKKGTPFVRRLTGAFRRS